MTVVRKEIIKHKISMNIPEDTSWTIPPRAQNSGITSELDHAEAIQPPIVCQNCVRRYYTN